MVSNPFIISGKIERDYFCDRKKESAELIRLIENGNNVVLISPRRMGKTGLIDYCFDDERIKSRYYTFFVDILQTSTLSEFIFLLGKEIYKGLASRGKKFVESFTQALRSLFGKFGFDPVSGLPTFNIQLGDITHPELTLEEIFEYLSGADCPCVVAIDEFQQIANYPEKNIEALLRSHIQRSANCNFIFSGSQRHIIQEMFMKSARPFYNSASIIYLYAITRSEYVPFIERMFADKGKTISPDTAGWIYDMFNGHTFYVQRLCNESFSYTVDGGVCDRAIVDYSLANILESYATLFRKTLSEMPVKQKELFYAIAQEGRARGVTSGAFVKKHSLSSTSSVQSALGKLLEKQLITQEEDCYLVVDRFFAIWLQRMLG